MIRLWVWADYSKRFDGRLAAVSRQLQQADVGVSRRFPADRLWTGPYRRYSRRVLFLLQLSSSPRSVIFYITPYMRNGSSSLLEQTFQGGLEKQDNLHEAGGMSRKPIELSVFSFVLDYINN